jgi:predicted nuclease of predicted toxin-antitoxin system
MRFIADESCDFAVVRALRSEGHDVTAVVDISPRASDRTVIDLAYQEDRILLTEDKDFGRLVYATRLRSPGVILIRFPSQVRAELPDNIATLVRTYAERLSGAFAVLQPGRVRFDSKIGSE